MWPISTEPFSFSLSAANEFLRVIVMNKPTNQQQKTTPCTRTRGEKKGGTCRGSHGWVKITIPSRHNCMMQEGE
jgi:hypothetical protein